MSVRLKGIRQLTVDKSDCELEVILAHRLGPIYKVVSCSDSQRAQAVFQISLDGEGGRSCISPSGPHDYNPL